ncbi:unnamed protein product [Paramecium octaurelia]|uniref:Uncharacterized protein n=1 Tax=Paramecium octaurelia TaxID=43137 RepID=A0A8S1W4U0_PAROT|nr:unnamed protein product [Paramecium octaurelia]
MQEIKIKGYIGGGFYYEGIKIGTWIELDDGSYLGKQLICSGSQLVQKYDGNLLKKKEIFSEIEVVRDLIMMEQRLESRQSYMMDFLLNNKQPIEGNIKMVKRFVNGIFKEIQLLQDIQNLIMLVDHMMKELRLPNELSWMMILFEKLVTHSGEYQNGKKQVGGILSFVIHLDINQK